jgi:NodT family efflux transporter outer membrane factor (OMF) lipoprotein
MTTTGTKDIKQHWQDRHRRNFAMSFRLLLFSKRRRCLIMAVWIIGLTACSLGPEYSRPNIPVPSAWNYQQENTAAVWPSTEWWRAFSSPHLDDLMAKAKQANYDIAAAISRVEEANAQARIAGAPLLPEVGVGATAIRERQPTSIGGTMETYSEYIPLLSASYELDFWGKNRAALEVARATASASRYDRTIVELTVMTAVANSYFQVLQLRDRISVAEKNLKDSESILKGLQLEQSIGTATSLDVAQQDIAVATISTTIPPLKQQLRQTLNAMAILTGQNPEAFDISTGTLADLSEPVVRPGLPSDLLTRRPDIAEAEAQLIAANANIKVARASFFPSIDLTASGGFESTALSTALNPTNSIFVLTAGIMQPIFEGGAIQGQYAYSKARYAELLANYHKTVISALGNVEDALVALQQTAIQQQRQQATVDKARLAYELSSAQFHAGTINILTVLNTESALFSAEDGLAQVKLLHLQALLKLYNALGGGWQQTKGKNNE